MSPINYFRSVRTQWAFTYSKLTIEAHSRIEIQGETVETQGVKYVQS